MAETDQNGKTFEQWKLNHEQAVATHASYQEDKRQVFGSAMDMALEAIRTAAIINGGAVVAVFALLGTLFEADDAASKAVRIGIVLPAFLFASGAVLSGIASGLSYFAQIAYARAHEEYHLTFEHPFVLETPSSRRFGIVGEFFRVIAVIAVLLSYASLIFGLALGYIVLSA